MFGDTHFDPALPSGGFRREPRSGIRLLAVVAVRDEMRYLPGLIANLAAQVDGIVALDDGSTDGTREYLKRCYEVLEVLTNPVDRPAWDEPGNHARLVRAAVGHRADWLLAIDADERVERDFRSRAERVIARGKRARISAYRVRIRELWGSPDLYRADGVWGRKTTPRLFAARPDHALDARPLHAGKAPLQAGWRGRYVLADLVVYHLRMVSSEDRAARRRRYEKADPELRWQPRHGYSYLTDEGGLVVRPVPRDRDYEPRPAA
jgi:glycosyltransferase involved in cell wall biosynthesis